MALVSFPGKNESKKKCTECGVEKPKKDFLDVPTNSDRKSGYCRECHKKKRKRYREKRTAQLEEQRKELPDQSEVLKECAECGKEKLKKDFGKSKKNPDGYEYDCTTCMREYKKEWSDKKKKAVKEAKLPDADKVIKECIKCETEKPLRLFKKCNTSWDGTYNFCQECDNEYSRELRIRIIRLREKQRNSLPDQSEVLKTCYQCGMKQPTKDFVKDRTSPDVTGNMCKKCYRKYQAEWARKRLPLLEKKRAELPDQSEVPKICIKCGTTKPTKEFGNDKKNLDGKTGTCIVCNNNRGSEWLAKPGNAERRKDRIDKLYHLDEGKQGKTYLKQKDRERKQRDHLKTRAKKMRRTMIYNAEKKGFQFDPVFTVEKLHDMIANTDYCPCCATKIDKFYYGDGERRSSVPSPDRVNNDLGYIEENVVVICWRCNWIKSDGAVDEFLKLVIWMTATYQKINGVKQ